MGGTGPNCQYHSVTDIDESFWRGTTLQTALQTHCRAHAPFVWHQPLLAGVHASVRRYGQVSEQLLEHGRRERAAATVWVGSPIGPAGKRILAWLGQPLGDRKGNRLSRGGILGGKPRCMPFGRVRQLAWPSALDFADCLSDHCSPNRAALDRPIFFSDMRNVESSIEYVYVKPPRIAVVRPGRRPSELTVQRGKL